MHPLMWIIIIVLGLYACGGLETPRRGLPPPSYEQAVKKRPMTEAEKHFGCRFDETAKNDKGEDTGECP